MQENKNSKYLHKVEMENLYILDHIFRSDSRSDSRSDYRSDFRSDSRSDCFNCRRSYIQFTTVPFKHFLNENGGDIHFQLSMKIDIFRLRILHKMYICGFMPSRQNVPVFMMEGQLKLRL